MTQFLRFVHTLARYRFVLAIQLVVQVASHRSIEKFNGVEKLLVVLVASDRCGSFLIKVSTPQGASAGGPSGWSPAFPALLPHISSPGLKGYLTIPYLLVCASRNVLDMYVRCGGLS